MRNLYPDVASETTVVVDRQDGSVVAAKTLHAGMALVLSDAHQGTASGGAMAAVAATRAILHSLSGARVSPDDTMGIDSALARALKAANSRVRALAKEQADVAGARVSAVAALVLRGRVHMAHVGDCRLHLIRDGRTIPMTRDHNVAQEWLERGIMSEADTLEHPAALKLERALGARSDVEVEVRTLPLRLEKADVLILSSPAVHRSLRPAEMASMSTGGEADNACTEMCSVACSRSDGCASSAVVYQAGPPRKHTRLRLLPFERFRSRQKVGLYVLAAVAMIGLALIAGTMFYDRDGAKEEVPHRTPTHQSAEIPHFDDLSPSATIVHDVRSQPELSPASAALWTPHPADVSDVIAVDKGSDVRRDSAVQDASQRLFFKKPPTGPELAGGSDAGAGDASALPPPTDVVAAADVISAAAVDTSTKAEVAAVSTADDQSPATVPGRPLEACSPTGLEGEVASDVARLSKVINRGLELLGRRHPDAKRAVAAYKEAKQLLEKAGNIARQRCEPAQAALAVSLKERYLKLVSSAAWKGYRFKDKHDKYCNKAEKRAKSAQRYGATRREIRKATRPCRRKR